MGNCSFSCFLTKNKVYCVVLPNENKNGYYSQECVVFMSIKIISDSTCDLSQELIQEYDIAITPLSVTIGDKTGRDGLEIHPEEIYDYVAQSGKLPKTSAVNVADYAAVYKEWTEKGYDIIQFCIGSGFSSTYQNACIAAEKYDNVHVVDTKNLSTGQGYLTLYAAKMVRNGATVDEILKKSEELTSKMETSFILDQLEYLHKGGRCSGIVVMGANLLKLKPCIEVKDGGMVVGKKYRGEIAKAAMGYITDRLKDRDDIDKSVIFITHTKCDQAYVDAVRQKIEELTDFEEILETPAGCTVTTHCGPSTLGVLFARK